MVAVSDELLSLDPSLNPIITRVYAARSRAAAAIKYSQEAPILFRLGYAAGSDRWEEASAGAGEPEAGGTLWVTYIAKSVTRIPTVCSFCGSVISA